MSKKCDVCGKAPIKAAKLTFSHKQIVHTQEPNLQSVKVNMNGTVKRIKVCTSCPVSYTHLTLPTILLV